MLGSHIFYELQNEIFSFSCALGKKKMPLFLSVRQNSWVYNACKFKYWVYWFHFSQAKLYFESPYVLLCLVVSNLYFIYLFIFAVIEQILFTAFLRRFNKNIRNTKEMFRGCVNYFYFIDWVLIRWMKNLSWPSSNDQMQAASIVVWVFGCLT